MSVMDVYKETNDKISNGIKVIIGLILIVAAVITDVAAGYANSYNDIVSIIMTAGMLSLVNALFSKIYKSPLSYILYMAGNMVGLLLYLFVISKYEIIGGLYTSLFAVLVFIVCWLMEMCLISGAGLVKRIWGGLLLNVVTLLATLVSTVVVVTVSVVMSMNG